MLLFLVLLSLFIISVVFICIEILFFFIIIIIIYNIIYIVIYIFIYLYYYIWYIWMTLCMYIVIYICNVAIKKHCVLPRFSAEAGKSWNCCWGIFTLGPGVNIQKHSENHENPWCNPFGIWSTAGGFSINSNVYRRVYIYIYIYWIYNILYWTLLIQLYLLREKFGLSFCGLSTFSGGILIEEGYTVCLYIWY